MTTGPEPPAASTPESPEFPTSREDNRTSRLQRIRAAGGAAEPLAAAPNEVPRRRQEPPASGRNDSSNDSGGGGGGGGATDLVNPRAPLEMARQFLAARVTINGQCTLRRWRNDFYGWHPKHHYRTHPGAEMRRAIYLWVETTCRRGENGTAGGRCDPNARLVSNIGDALDSVVLLDSRMEPPAWLAPVDAGEPAPAWLAPLRDMSGDLAGDRPPASEFLAVDNGLLVSGGAKIHH